MKRLIASISLMFATAVAVTCAGPKPIPAVALPNTAAVTTQPASTTPAATPTENESRTSGMSGVVSSDAPNVGFSHIPDSEQGKSPGHNSLEITQVVAVSGHIPPGYQNTPANDQPPAPTWAYAPAAPSGRQNYYVPADRTTFGRFRLFRGR